MVRSWPVAAARSQEWMVWSAISWLQYSSTGKSPNDRCTRPPSGSLAPMESIASLAAASALAFGSEPSTSPSNWSPTSAIVCPSTSGVVQRSSPTTWLTRVRTSHSVHGVGSSHWSSRRPAIVVFHTSTARWCSLLVSISPPVSLRPFPDVTLAHSQACVECPAGLIQPPRERGPLALAHGRLGVVDDVEGLVPRQPHEAGEEAQGDRPLVVHVAHALPVQRHDVVRAEVEDLGAAREEPAEVERAGSGRCHPPVDEHGTVVLERHVDRRKVAVRNG